MGKVKPRLIGDTEVEEKQKKEQKAKSMEKKMLKQKDIGDVGVDRDQPVKPPKSKIVGVGRDRPVSNLHGKNYQEARND